MGYKQLKSANSNLTDVPGYCHRYARRIFGIGAKYQSALANWNASKTKNTGGHPTNVAVPIWFTVRGHNYGHVVVFVPGVGYLSTAPGSGTGQTRVVYKSIADVNKAFGATLLGWTLDINDVAVAEWVPDPAKSIAQLAAEVWAGKWGTGAERIAKLTAAGYNAAAVQAEVNKGRPGAAPAPARRTYTVQKGDNLSKIAKKYGVSVDALYNLNRAVIGKNKNVIYSGTVLLIP